MPTSTIGPVRLLLALAVAGALLVAADGSRAATGGAPTACHGLSPASAVGCPAEVFTP